MKDLRINKQYLAFLACFFYISFFSQNKDLNCWKANTSYNNDNFKENSYNLKIRNDSIIFSINDTHDYKSKLYKTKKDRYFFFNDEKMIIKEENLNKMEYLIIRYYEKKNRISVNEITTLKFTKCL